MKKYFLLIFTYSFILSSCREMKPEARTIGHEVYKDGEAAYYQYEFKKIDTTYSVANTNRYDLKLPKEDGVNSQEALRCYLKDRNIIGGYLYIGTGQIATISDYNEEQEILESLVQDLGQIYYFYAHSIDFHKDHHGRTVNPEGPIAVLEEIFPVFE